MAKKYYAVKVGQTTGVFETWEECEKSVKGYPGALYKSFNKISDAYSYMGWEGKQLSLFDQADMDLASTETDTLSPISNESEPEVLPFSNSVSAVAYVDGSYNIETKEFGYGAVIFYNGEQIKLSGKGQDADSSNMRNVSGEIQASMVAMQYAIDNEIHHIKIVYDYMGIEKWCTGEWKTNKEGTKKYKEFYDNAKKYVDIKFQKVKGHSGDIYNDMADRLAKNAVGVE